MTQSPDHHRSRPASPGAVLRLLALLAVLFGAWATTGDARAQGLFGGSGDDDRRNAELSLRIQQLEGQMRGLNGQIEQMNYQVRQLQDLIGRMQKDYEFRLQEIENGRGAAKPMKKSEGPGDVPASAPSLAPSMAAPSMAAPPSMAAAPPPPTRGAPPADLGRLPASADPIGGLIGSAPLDLGARAAAPGTAPIAESAPVPGVDPRFAATAPTASPRDEYDAAYGYILNGEYDLAEHSFKTFLANHPTDKRIGAAQFWLGESYYARNRHKEAADAFLQSYTQFPDGPKAPDSLLKLGMALSGLGEKKAACASWEELLVKFPKASKAVRDRAAAEKTRGKC